MIAHAVYDIVQLLNLSYEVRRRGAEQILELTRSGQGDELNISFLAIGAVAISVGFVMLKRQRAWQVDAL